MSPRTGTAYKAKREDEPALHGEVPGSSRMVDAEVVQLQFAFLSGEIPTAESGREVSRGRSTAGASAGRAEHEWRGEPLRSSQTSMKPNGGDGMRSPQDKPEPRNGLLERILSRGNMQKAWKRVKANKGAPGIDEMTVEEFPEFARKGWETIRTSLMKGTYQPRPVRRVEIPKASGGTRPLGIPTVTDRVIQQAISQVLGGMFEPAFSENSYGFRPGRSAHQAVNAVRRADMEGYSVAVDADLSKFFDTVNHDKLMSLLGRRVRDKRVLRLIARYLHAGFSKDGVVGATVEGVPQGGPLSPLLANIVLDELDKELERRGHRFARYADDFIILVKSVTAGRRVFAGIRKYIERKLHLRINESKSKVAPVRECDFLGFRISGRKIRWSPDVGREFKRRIKELTSRSWGISMEERIRKLSEYMRGWMNYFGISEYYRPIPDLEVWIRRRIRLCFWKMWKKTRRRRTELIKLGTHPMDAILTARSRQGYWHLSRSLATQTGMTNSWLSSLGLPSIKEQWIAIHYPHQRKATS